MPTDRNKHSQILAKDAAALMNPHPHIVAELSSLLTQLLQQQVLKQFILQILPWYLWTGDQFQQELNSMSLTTLDLVIQSIDDTVWRVFNCTGRSKFPYTQFDTLENLLTLLPPELLVQYILQMRIGQFDNLHTISVQIEETTINSLEGMLKNIRTMNAEKVQLMRQRLENLCREESWIDFAKRQAKKVTSLVAYFDNAIFAADILAEFTEVLKADKIKYGILALGICYSLYNKGWENLALLSLTALTGLATSATIHAKPDIKSNKPQNLLANSFVNYGTQQFFLFSLETYFYHYSHSRLFYHLLSLLLRTTLSEILQLGMLWYGQPGARASRDELNEDQIKRAIKDDTRRIQLITRFASFILSLGLSYTEQYIAVREFCQKIGLATPSFCLEVQENCRTTYATCVSQQGFFGRASVEVHGMIAGPPQVGYVDTFSMSAECKVNLFLHSCSSTAQTITRRYLLN